MALTKVKGSGLATGAATESLVGIDDNATSTAITINSSDNVGIGAAPKTWSSERSALQVNGITSLAASAAVASSAGILYHNSYMNAAGLEKYIVADEASAYMQQNGNHYLKTAAVGTADATITWTTAMSIDNVGRVGLINHLDMSGTLIYSTIGSGGIAIQTTPSGNHSYIPMKFRNVAGGEIGTIACSTTGTAYNTSSDYRLKENVVPMSGSIDRLKALKPSKFNFIADATTIVDGFLAHEAGEVVPECVAGLKDAMMDEEYEVTPAVMDGETVVTEAVMGTRSVPDYQGIDQSKLVPLLVASLQEAVAKIEALEARVTALEPTI